MVCWERGAITGITLAAKLSSNQYYVVSDQRPVTIHSFAYTEYMCWLAFAFYCRVECYFRAGLVRH